jgi:predicted HAD superfamily Cof-like phosphohydrolase
MYPDDIREFQSMLKRPAPRVPTVPSDEVMRLRLRLICEEFCELMQAAGIKPQTAIYAALMDLCQSHPLAIDLPEFVDAMADLDYVVEGTRQELGIDGPAVHRLVHAANMAKQAGPVDATGKKRKPEGWKPPDIAGELRRQGWKP